VSFNPWLLEQPVVVDWLTLKAFELNGRRLFFMMESDGFGEMAAAVNFEFKSMPQIEE
jgi:hypothetical protein